VVDELDTEESCCRLGADVAESCCAFVTDVAVIDVAVTDVAVTDVAVTLVAETLLEEEDEELSTFEMDCECVVVDELETLDLLAPVPDALDGSSYELLLICVDDGEAWSVADGVTLDELLLLLLDEPICSVEVPLFVTSSFMYFKSLKVLLLNNKWDDIRSSSLADIEVWLDKMLLMLDLLLVDADKSLVAVCGSLAVLLLVTDALDPPGMSARAAARLDLCNEIMAIELDL
jgi:hypothetical protein